MNNLTKAQVATLLQSIDREEAVHNQLDAELRQSGEYQRAARNFTHALQDGRKMSAEDREWAVYKTPMPEFKATSKLYIPTGPDDRGDRPLGGHPGGDDSSIHVIENHQRVFAVAPERDYRIRVRVRNGGDLHVGGAAVELFRQPDVKQQQLIFNTTKLSFLFRRAMVTGRLAKGAISYGDHVRWRLGGFDYFLRVVGVIVLEENGSRSLTTNHSTLPGHSHYQLWLEVGDLRPGMKQLQDHVGVINEAPDYRPEQRMFRLRVEKSLPPILVGGSIEQGSLRPGSAKVRVFSNKIPGQRRRQNVNSTDGEMFPDVQNPRATFNGLPSQVNFFRGLDCCILRTNRRRDLQADDLVLYTDPVAFTPERRPVVDNPDTQTPQPVYIGQQSVDLAGHDETWVEFTYRSGAAGSDEFNGRPTFYARVYAMLPFDMPENVEVWDPLVERRVGRVFLDVGV